jgi:hypothetical protein
MNGFINNVSFKNYLVLARELVIDKKASNLRLAWQRKQYLDSYRDYWLSRLLV